MLIVSKLDRLSRSVADFANLSALATRQGWRLVILDLALDGTTPQGELMANVLAAYFNLNVTSQAAKFGFGDGDLLDDALTLTPAQAAALGLPTNTTVGAYLQRVNTIMAGKNGVIPAGLFITINDVSDKINNSNHV